MTAEWKIRQMEIGDFEGSLELWSRTDGMGLGSSDTKEEIGKFLDRNPGLSFVCEAGGRIVGTVLGGHDGRRAFLYHLAVAPDIRRQGIGGRLIAKSLEGFQAAGINKCHLFVLMDNVTGIEYYRRSGWQQRDDFLVFSQTLLR